MRMERVYCAVQPPSMTMSVPVMIAGVLGAEIDGEFPDLLGLAPAADRNLREELRAANRRFASGAR